MSRTLVRIIDKIAQRRDRPLKFSFDDLATTQVGSKKTKTGFSPSSFFPLAFSPRSIVRRNFTFTSELTFYDPNEVFQDLCKATTKSSCPLTELQFKTRKGMGLLALAYNRP